VGLHIGFVITIQVAAVYVRDWYHVLLMLLYLIFIMVYLAISLEEKGEKECPNCLRCCIVVQDVKTTISTHGMELKVPRFPMA
jgi:hypothetical protein